MKKTIGAGALLVSLLIVLLTALPAAAISEHPLPASSFFAPSFTDDNKMTTQSRDDYPSPTSDFFVNDFASCLTEEDKSTIQALGEELYEKTKAQVVVVTVQSLGGRDIESYSIGLAREWGIGDKDDDSGVLLLLSTGDRQVRMERVLRALSPTVNRDEFSIPMQFRTSKTATIPRVFASATKSSSRRFIPNTE